MAETPMPAQSNFSGAFCHVQKVLPLALFILLCYNFYEIE